MVTQLVWVKKKSGCNQMYFSAWVHGAENISSIAGGSPPELQMTGPNLTSISREHVYHGAHRYRSRSQDWRTPLIAEWRTMNDLQPIPNEIWNKTVHREAHRLSASDTKQHRWDCFLLSLTPHLWCYESFIIKPEHARPAGEGEKYSFY